MTPPGNRDIARLFLQIGDLMEYQGANAFKIRSYWRIAEVLLGLEEPLAAIAARGELEQVPGVGDAIRGKVDEILATGTCALYERLKTEVSGDIQAMLEVPGLTPRLVRILELERGVRTVAQLRETVRIGLDDVPNVTAGDRAAVLRAVVLWSADT